MIRIAVVDGTNDLRVSIDEDGDGTFDLRPYWSWSDIENFNSIY